MCEDKLSPKCSTESLSAATCSPIGCFSASSRYRERRASRMGSLMASRIVKEGADGRGRRRVVPTRDGAQAEGETRGKGDASDGKIALSQRDLTLRGDRDGPARSDARGIRDGDRRLIEK